MWRKKSMVYRHINQPVNQSSSAQKEDAGDKWYRPTRAKPARERNAAGMLIWQLSIIDPSFTAGNYVFITGDSGNFRIRATRVSYDRPIGANHKPRFRQEN